MASEPEALRHIGILVFDDVEELDAVGPYEVLAHWTQEYANDGWSVAVARASQGSVHSGGRRNDRLFAVQYEPLHGFGGGSGNRI